MSYRTRKNFIDSEEANEVRTMLEEMTANPKYFTEETYSANSEKYPDHRINFVDKHIDYLANHPDVDIKYYISNLKLSVLVR